MRKEIILSDFQNWKNVFYRAESGSVDERQALLQMATFAKTFGQWLNVYCESGPLRCFDEVVRKVAFKQLSLLADDPQDATWCDKPKCLRLQRWVEILRACPADSKEEFIAEGKVVAYFRENKRKYDEKIQEVLQKGPLDAAKI